MSDLEQALAEALAQGDDWATMIAGGRLALGRLAKGDLEGLAALLRHENTAISHGAAEALAQESPAIEPAVGPLAEALPDNTGAVLYHGLRALKQAAAAGVDLTPAFRVLEQLFGTDRYETSGWTYGLDPSEQSDLLAERPSRDAAEALGYHALARGDLDAVRRLLQHDAATVVHGALKAVRANERHSDAARREQAARLLVPAYAKIGAWAGVEALIRSDDAPRARGARAGISDALNGQLVDDDARTRLEALAAS